MSFLEKNLRRLRNFESFANVISGLRNLKGFVNLDSKNNPKRRYLNFQSLGNVGYIITLSLLFLMGISSTSCNRNTTNAKTEEVIEMPQTPPGGISAPDKEVKANEEITVDKDCVEKSEKEYPIPCPDLFAPVCGCNQITYNNSCEAERAGVKQWEEGACE